MQRGDDCEYTGRERRKRCEHAEEAAEVAVKKTFAILGVNVDDPQQVSNFQQDLRFGRKLREMADRGTLPALIVLLSLISAAFVAGMIQGGK